MSWDLPEPDCRMGYTGKQVADILGDFVEEFNDFMRGQTCGVCEGKIAMRNLERCDVAHGVVVYGTDLRRFLEGLPVID